MSKAITWQAPEFIHYPKSTAWFALLAVIGTALTGYALWQKDFLTAALFALLCLTVFYFSRKKPKILTITLTTESLSFGEVRLPWQRIKSFWIIYNPPEVKTLNFETSAYLNRLITIQLAEADPSEIRKFLLEYLPEEENHDEQLSDKISRKLKF